MHLCQYCLLVTARSLYMFRTLSASIIRSTKIVVAELCHHMLVFPSFKEVKAMHVFCYRCFVR